MDLYDVKARGLHSPLNAREIAQLVRTGRFDPSSPCKPIGEARWRTVAEVFPLLRSQTEAFALTFDDPGPRRSSLRSVARLAAAALLIGGLGLYWWARSPS